MYRIILFSILSLATIFSLQGQDSKAVRAVKNILAEQSDDWNRGDIDAFMEHYWQSEELQFIGSSGVTYGWQSTLENYKKRYPSRQAMGKLKFDVLKVNRRSRKVLSLVGKFYLTRDKEIGDLSGHFILIFQKIKGRWLIVADHTS